MIRFKDIIAEHGGDPTCFLSFDDESDQVNLLPYATLSAARTTADSDPLSALIGVYEWQNAPLFMLVNGDALSSDPDGLRRLRRVVAMRGDAPYLAVLQMGKLTFHSVGLDNESFDATKSISDELRDVGMVIPFVANERPNTSSRQTWISDVILNLLTVALDKLVVLKIDDGDAISFVGRALFTRFLADRGLLPSSIVKAGKSRITIEAKRSFAEAYAALAAEILPDLSVRPSSDGPKALTRIFDGFDLKPEFPDVKLRHEFGSNDPVKYANVLFGGLADRASALNESGVFSGTPYKAEVAGKSLAVRVNTPGIDPTSPFEREHDNVVIGLNAIRSLTDWLAGNRASIGEIAFQQEEQRKPEVPERADDVVRYPTEADFKEQLWATYRECDALGYKPTGMLEMMQRLGAIATAKQLLAKPPSEGFSRLAELGRLDLAIESIALEPRWSALFSEAELKIARRRLR